MVKHEKQPNRQDLSMGARNLLAGAGRFGAGDAVLLVHEDPALGWYSRKTIDAVISEARKLGIDLDMLQVGPPSNERDQEEVKKITAAANVVFMARLGDQDRFAAVPHGKTVIMSYARSPAQLASSFGRTSHAAMSALKQATNEVLLGAETIELSCSLGTSVTGKVSRNQKPDEDVGVRRFPLGVPIPLLAESFEGRVALAGYLTTTGSKVYQPAWIKLQNTVLAEIKDGAILRFCGDSATVEAIDRHYDHVAGLFGIERNAVHSWHAGLHPGSFYEEMIEDDPDQWSNTIFMSPRYLHFHTCGAYAPGEICWMIADPTIRLDGVALWKNGTFHPDLHPATAAELDQHNDLKALFLEDG